MSLALLLWAVPLRAVHAQSQSAPIEIEVARGAPYELQAREQLQRILTTWNLQKWLFTRRVRIETGAIPHSHPTLTLNSQYVGRDTVQIATLVHEQLHWFFAAHSAATDSAIADLARLFPDAPSGPPDGARDRQSTYLHLLVCLSELNAMTEIFNEAVARRTLGAFTHYGWIYREVLARPARIQDLLRRHALDKPDARVTRDAARDTNSVAIYMPHEKIPERNR